MHDAIRRVATISAAVAVRTFGLRGAGVPADATRT
jgi:hypothetical protein